MTDSLITLPPETQDDDLIESRRGEVKRWLSLIKAAKRKCEPTFEQIRRNQKFVRGLQWPGQTKVDDERYKNNLTNRMVNAKVAQLYAKDPKTTVTRRKRLDYMLWDEQFQTLVEAITAVQQSTLSGGVPPLGAMALIADYEQGRQRQKLIDRVCRTAEIVYQHQVDSHHPEFKEQMKQLVRRVIICKVGYVKLSLCRRSDEYSKLSSVTTPSDIKARISRAKEILVQLDEGKLTMTSADVEEVRSLLRSVGASTQQGDELHTEEYLEFDFPPATSIIPSEGCRSLKEFVAAEFVAQEHNVDVDIVNALFNVEVQPSENDDEKRLDVLDEDTPKRKKKVCLYEVLDLVTRSRFFVCKGYKDYILPPEPNSPPVAGFWNLFALTFNDVEGSCDNDEEETGLFPPSDVDLIRDPQMEWNRTRDALRDQRNANAPKYPIRDGLLSEEDELAIKNAVPNSLIKLKNLPPDVKPSEFIQPLQVARIDPAVYDTRPLAEDMQLAIGMQEANMGPAMPNVTATVGTIAEQSRLTVVSSNVDDLDGFLSRIARAGVEMLLRGMSPETVKRIAGPGAAWPTNDIEDYLNEIIVKIQAASSGRPNRVLEVTNAQMLGQLLLQAGGNPIPLVEKIARILEEDSEIDKYFPIVPSTLTQSTGVTGRQPQQQQRMLSPQQENMGLGSMMTMGQ